MHRICHDLRPDVEPYSWSASDAENPAWLRLHTRQHERPVRNRNLHGDHPEYGRCVRHDSDQRVHENQGGGEEKEDHRNHRPGAGGRVLFIFAVAVSN